MAVFVARGSEPTAGEAECNGKKWFASAAAAMS
jgi:hypothetical protein